MKFWLFKTLLKSFCNYDLDQWAMWSIPTKHGLVYVTISRHTDYPKAFQELK